MTEYDRKEVARWQYRIVSFAIGDVLLRLTRISGSLGKSCESAEDDDNIEKMNEAIATAIQQLKDIPSVLEYIQKETKSVLSHDRWRMTDEEYDAVAHDIGKIWKENRE